MPKLRLKILMRLFNGVMAAKRALLFLLHVFFRHILEKTGRLLAKFLIFPFYKLYLKLHLKDYNFLQIIFNPKVFFILFVLTGIFLSASQTKTYGTGKYIGGEQSLMFQYLSLGPGANSDYIEEENADVVSQETVNINLQPGLSASVAANDNLLSPTYDLVSFSALPLAVETPLIMPGVELGGVRREIIKYAVQQGDTLATVATKFGINIETLANENKITAKTILHPGDVLNVLPVKGVAHIIKKGDTLKKIAALYKVDVAKITDFNAIVDDSDLHVGETIIIPEGKLPPVITPIVRRSSQQPSQVAGNRPVATRGYEGEMLWPTINHNLTQYFSWHHSGIDIGIPLGSPIYAADDGVVDKSGWNTGGYGYMILIDHANGIKTRYGHNSKLFVSAGEDVHKGDVIALSGSTGRSTGPHLHFEVIVNGRAVNPFLYVR